MGGAKDQMIRDQENQQWALGVLAEAKVLEYCEHHSEYYYDGGEEVEAAYRLANVKISRGDAPFSSAQRRKATDAIKAAFESHDFVDSCRSCDKMMAE